MLKIRYMLKYFEDKEPLSGQHLDASIAATKSDCNKITLNFKM